MRDASHAHKWRSNFSDFVISELGFFYMQSILGIGNDTVSIRYLNLTFPEAEKSESERVSPTLLFPNKYALQTGLY